MSITSTDKAQFKVGDAVSLRLGGNNAVGLIVEDRGRLGVAGTRLYRVLVSLPSEDPFTFEMPEDQLALHVARRALFTEMTNRVIATWWGMLTGGPLDHLTGYQNLSKAVFDACREVAKRVRDESINLANKLGLDPALLPAGDAKSVADAQECGWRIASRAGGFGLEGLHQQIEDALWEAAKRERGRVQHAAEHLGWHDFESAIRHPLDSQQHPFLALLAQPALDKAVA